MKKNLSFQIESNYLNGTESSSTRKIVMKQPISKVDFPQISIDDKVKKVRPHLVCRYVTNLEMTADSIKSFLQLQNKLHKGICCKRTLATIASHDAGAIFGSLLFTAKLPSEIKFTPLMSESPVTADEYAEDLRKRGEVLKKEKKRSQVTGLHQFLHLMENWSVYPCLLDGEDVISLPPLSNANKTRLSEETKNVLLEVSSSKSLSNAELVMESLLSGMTNIWNNFTVVEAKIVDRQ